MHGRFVEVGVAHELRETDASAERSCHRSQQAQGASYGLRSRRSLHHDATSSDFRSPILARLMMPKPDDVVTVDSALLQDPPRVGRSVGDILTRSRSQTR